MTRFYSVQSDEDAARLSAGGLPWPTGLERANLGIGFYAWESLPEAEHYRNQLQRHGATGLGIVIYEISEEGLSTLKTLDLTQRSDDEVNSWMDRHSQYGEAEPHDWQHILRYTELGVEHYFAAAVFDRLKEVL
jgi:hypothetical protein